MAPQILTAGIIRPYTVRIIYEASSRKIIDEARTTVIVHNQ